MLKLIDRQMIRGYFKAYFACLTSLLSMYIVVDLFLNLDDFMHRYHGLGEILRHVLSYYSLSLSKYFDLMSEPVVLLAAMFTVALLQRHNEQLPLLSAGVSTQRIVTPVLICAAAMLSLTVLNQELLIPRIGERLLNPKDDPDGEKELQVHQAYEPTDVEIGAGADGKATRKAQRVTKLECIIPKKIAGNVLVLLAEVAYYHPSPDPAAGPGGWELLGVQSSEPNVVPLDWNGQKLLDVIDKGHYFLYTRVVDFDTLTHTHDNWYQVASTSRLYGELQRASSTTRLAPMAVLFHMRLTRPLLGLLLVVMGLSVILRDQTRNVFISSGLCLVLCGLFFGVLYSCKMLGDHDLLEPALAAWLPVLFFGPLALVLFDAVHT
jgi:lipopolysaccharide export system permease protein